MCSAKKVLNLFLQASGICSRPIALYVLTQHIVFEIEHISLILIDAPTLSQRSLQSEVFTSMVLFYNEDSSVVFVFASGYRYVLCSARVVIVIMSCCNKHYSDAFYEMIVYACNCK